MDTALPGAPTSAAPNTEEQPQLKAVTITDNGDGTFSVTSTGTQPEVQQEQSTAESEMPVKGIDAACAKAKEILTGEIKEDLQGIFNAQFPAGKAQEQQEYGSRY